jgi:DNA repair exonuclease SbcCD nuclease subunit
LFANVPDVYVAHSEYVQVPIKNLDMSVFCLCHRALPNLNSLKIEPDPSSKYNVLMVHGTLEGVIHSSYDIFEIRRDQVISDAWVYVAFGHYHVFEELALNAYYAGSTEYTSTNIWSETKQPKGLIEYDLDEHELVGFHKIDTRDVIDLRPIDAAGVAVGDLNTMIQRRIESIYGGHEDKIVRLVIENLHRSMQANLDFSLIRQVRSEALHFELQLRPPSRDGRTLTSGSDSGAAKPLEEEWDDFAKVYDVPAGVERERFVNLGRNYLMQMARDES